MYWSCGVVFWEPNGLQFIFVLSLAFAFFPCAKLHTHTDIDTGTVPSDTLGSRNGGPACRGRVTCKPGREAGAMRRPKRRRSYPKEDRIHRVSQITTVYILTFQLVMFRNGITQFEEQSVETDPQRQETRSTPNTCVSLHQHWTPPVQYHYVVGV